MNNNVIAAFDFDGTLTFHDTLLPFLKFVKGIYQTSYGLLRCLPYLPLGLADSRYRQRAKESVLSHTIGGMNINTLKQKGEEYAQKMLDSRVRPEARKKLLWHRNQGHRCILISATLDVYLEPWARQAGFQDLICSRLEVNSDNTVSGKLRGLNCWGEEKASRLLQLLGPQKNYTLYAYGDSRGDKELLDFADYPFYRKFSRDGF